VIYPDFPSSTRGKFEFETANFDEKTNSEKDEFQQKKLILTKNGFWQQSILEKIDPMTKLSLSTAYFYVSCGYHVVNNFVQIIFVLREIWK